MSQDEMTEYQRRAPGIARRTMTSAVAWSVPVITLAAAAPAHAASAGTTLTLTVTRGAAEGDLRSLSFVVTIEGTPPYTGPTTLAKGTLQLSLTADKESLGGSLAGQDFGAWEVTGLKYSNDTNVITYYFTYQAELTVNDGGTSSLEVLFDSGPGNKLSYTLTSGGVFPPQEGEVPV